ncbi:MAG: type II secretion system F family protein [Demequinaceae bacterium]|nr:type II secretion system F family protein [Demequinaceae bacterium]
MGMILGLTGGTGAFCVWWSFWAGLGRPRRECRWSVRMQDDIVLAGLKNATPFRLIGAGMGIGVLAGLLSMGLTRAPMIGLVLGALASRAPFALVYSRARRRRALMREAWPEAVDNLVSAIRAGLSLPEAIGQLGERGPEQVRLAFAAFAEDFRASGRFDDCLGALKNRLADPVADRIIESLRVTRDVGGSDLGRVLRTLAAFLREDARTRGELEARQSWTVNGARLAVVAPWAVLLLLASRPETAAAYGSPMGMTVLVGGAACTVIAYRLMTRVGRLPVEERVLR